jgi:hypothetical protein
MRIGVSSSGRAWVSMGPLAWLIYLVFVLPVVAVCCAAVLLVRLCVLICEAIAARRARQDPPGSSR